MPLNQMADDRLTDDNLEKYLAARERLEAAPLSVFAGPAAAEYWLS